MTVELLSYIPEIFLIFVIMILVIYGVLTASKSTLGHIPDQPIDVNVISLLTIQTLLCSLLFIDFSSDSKPTILALTFLFLIATLYILSTLNLIQFDNVYNFEFLILVLCAILGMDLLIKADNLISMYLALELQSLAFYVLAAYRRTSLYGTESGLKYYVMGGFSSCILLLGIAFLYGLTGLTQYSDLTLYLQTGILDQTILTSAFILILIGFLFKLAAAPFHM
jgi:NADH:ubiquinone oxidoreductase subunit 2 (subunit N)